MNITTVTSSLQSMSQAQQVLPAFDRKAAEETFWGLKDQFWKQIIDGRFHKDGPMVFDEGLSGTKEPGFFKSMQEGCRYAASCLGDKPTVHFYKQLHGRMCSHFRGKENNTLFQAYERGEFRNKWVEFTFSTKLRNEEAKKHFDIVEEGQMFSKSESFDKTEYEKSCKWVDDFQAEWKQKIEVINDRIKNFFTSIGFPVITKVEQNYGAGRYCHQQRPREEMERLIGVVFDLYNQKIEKINQDFQFNDKQSFEMMQDQKIEAIADLYQKLEWIHPFQDGQGRTDLVLLSKLLCDEGLNPPILVEPYMSSWNFLEDWKEYLKKGIELWREEKSTGTCNSNFKIGLHTDQTYPTKQIQPDLSSFKSIPGADIFWGLGEDFWKQIIDGELHSCGPLVFEDRTPGFFASIREGCIFATQHLGKKLDMDFYRMLNHRVCSSDQDNAVKGGKFRDKWTSYTFSTVKVSREEKGEEAGDFFYCVHMFQVARMLKKPFSETQEAEYDRSVEWIDKFHKKWDEKIAKINTCIQNFYSELQIPVCTHLKRWYGTANYTYDEMQPVKLEKLVQALFDQYHQKMSHLNAKITSNPENPQKELRNQKLEAIADLFQKLEWLNPFQQDQGKTDLILLSKLLCEEGFNPPILRFAFTSSWAPLQEWTEYLKKGIELWQEKKNNARKRKRF